MFRIALKWMVFIYLKGYIPRLIRASLAIIDLAAPYVNVVKKERVDNQLSLNWKVGGASEVNKVWVYYDYIDNQNDFMYIF